LCGVHSWCEAEKLPKNPNKRTLKQDRYRTERQEIEEAAAANLRSGHRGALIVTKLRMMRAPEHHPGFMKVFPNNRHGGRSDGLGLPSLSPMRLGPVNHGQPGLPPAMTIEGFHQFGKVFPTEVDSSGEPVAEWFAMQLDAYRSLEPSRHKPAANATTTGNKNVPLYSAWVQRNGVRKKVTYIESRQFYCGFYERLVAVPDSEAATDFESLRACLDSGYNLQIVGYDGRPVDEKDTDDLAGHLEKMYLDPSAPFGHELVLYTLLAVENPADYPWRRNQTEVF
jgi:hypothetical protein